MRDAQVKPDIGPLLLTWYAREKRDLPWRSNRDPYGIWLSEVMLQQTRVATVIPYYERFLSRFPSVRALAEAPESDVLAAWSGLGYYRRARMLHAGAKAIAQRARFPSTREELLSVPGIGPYTASAVASIAYGEPVELVDGNVARVLSRLFALEVDVKSPRGASELWAVAKRELRRDEPSAWNQALMELGATVCTPKKPTCEACPLRVACAAFAQDRVDELPRTTPKKKPLEEARTSLVLVAGPTVLVGERRSNLRFGGLWEPPMVERDMGSSDVLTAFTALLGPLPSMLRVEDCGIVVHVLSHRRMSVRVYSARIVNSPGRETVEPSGDYARFAQMPLDEAVEARGMSTLARRVLALALDLDASSVRAPKKKPRVQGAS